MLGQVFGAVTGVVVARAVGPAGRGEVATIVLWGQLIGWVASFSLDKALIVLTKEDHGGIGRSVALVTSRRLVIAFTVPAIIFSVALGSHLFNGWYLPVAMGLIAAATAQAELVGGWLLALRRRPLYNLWRLTQPIVYFVVVGGVAILRLAMLITTLTAITFLAAGILLSICAPTFILWLPSLRPAGGSFSKRAARRLVRYGLAAQTANILTYLNGQLDLLTLTLISSSTTVGIYAVGSSMGQVVVLLGSAAIIRGLTGEGGRRDYKGIIASLLVCLLVIALSPSLVPIVFGASFRSAAEIAQILAIGNMLNFVLQADCGQLLGKNHPWQATISQGLGVVAFASLVFRFHTPHGVAWSSDVAYGVSLLIAECALRRNSSEPRIA